MRNLTSLLLVFALVVGLLTGLCSCKKASDLDATDEAPEGVTSASGAAVNGGAATGKSMSMQKRPAPGK